MFIQTDILEKNGAQKMERCMFINIKDACTFVDNERKTHKFSADLLIRNALY